MKFIFPKSLCFFGLAILSNALHSQVVTVDPVFPKETDTITVVFDAALGNGALKGATQVYAHAGVITNLSTSSANWKYVVGTWGTADARVKMISMGNDKWKLRYHMKSFYTQAGAFAPNETIQQLSFVFRNQDGSIVGRSANGGDIFSPVYSAASSLILKITLPEAKTTIGKTTDILNVNAYTSKSSNIDLYYDGNLLRSLTSKDSLQALFTNFTLGSHKIKITAKVGSETSSDSITYIVNPNVTALAIPSGLEQGINYINDSTVYLVLYAPYKSYVYAIGDFSNWQPDTKYFMNFDLSKSLWWTKVEGLTPKQEVGYQYFIDGKLRVADPFSPLMLSEWDDEGIPAANYPNLKPYPKNKTSGWVTVMQPGAPSFSWSKMKFNRPSKDKLVIYECLIRDFTKAQTFKSVQDSLPYLKRLGITALQLMPVFEFEGNLSWGYNPASHMAIDKFYGTRDALKSLIDAAHQQGIAIILDVVFNHAFGSASICQMYWDDKNSRPAQNGPYANPIPTHPFNVGNDLNHESSATRYYVKRILKYVLEEFHVDGFRFDLSKGFTQKNSGSDVNVMGQYDASRIAIWKDYNNAVKAVDNEAYSILEHFADNSEEKELAANGMMLWGNAHYNMNQAAEGVINNSDFGWGIDYTKRSFSGPNLVSYAVSHDEERMAYSCINYGTAVSGYSTRNNPIFMDRMALSYSFLWLTPGPKMIWQFDELGYDYSINHCVNGTVNNSCRLDQKPVRWDYWTSNNNRRRLYFKNAMMLHLKKTYTDVSAPLNFGLNASGKFKRLQINGGTFTTLLYGSFDLTAQPVTPAFPFTGMWYDYLSGDSLNVTNVNMAVSFKPSEFRVWTSKRIDNPFLGDMAKMSVSDLETEAIGVYPNPASQTLHVAIPTLGERKFCLYNLSGQMVLETKVFSESEIDISNLSNGMYVFKIFGGQKVSSGKVVVQK